MIDKSEANLAAREAINAKRETLPVAQVQEISLRPHCPERHRSNAHDRHGIDERCERNRGRTHGRSRQSTSGGIRRAQILES